MFSMAIKKTIVSVHHDNRTDYSDTGVTAEYPATSSVLGKWLATRYAVRSENKFKMAVDLKLVATRYAVWG